jgi:predicted phage-related endonuclease
MSANPPGFATKPERRYFVGGSDARVIMGQDEAALLRLWREKRGENEPEDLDSNIDPLRLGESREKPAK